MSIINTAIAGATETLGKLTTLKNALLVEIKKGDMSLYPEYLEVCGDVLSLTSKLSKIK